MKVKKGDYVKERLKMLAHKLRNQDARDAARSVHQLKMRLESNEGFIKKRINATLHKLATGWKDSSPPQRYKGVDTTEMFFA